MQTSHPNIYACGDSIGGSMLAHTGLQEGAIAAMGILGMDARSTIKLSFSSIYES